MKKLLLISTVVVFAMGCTNNDTKDAKGGDTTKMAAATADNAALPDMPFPLEHPYPNWKPGDPQNAVTAMKSLKAFTTGDINACMEGFGDSVRVGFDNFQAKISRDSLKANLTRSRGELSSINIKMDDWESVISADKKDEWVTLWYKEYHTDKKGVTDSMGVVDDLKISNGKIIVLDEKTQKLGPPKKM